jgi:hypothetical protein
MVAAVVMDIGSLPRRMRAQVGRRICWPGAAEAHERDGGLMTGPGCGGAVFWSEQDGVSKAAGVERFVERVLG